MHNLYANKTFNWTYWEVDISCYSLKNLFTCIKISIFSFIVSLQHCSYSSGETKSHTLHRLPPHSTGQARFWACFVIYNRPGNYQTHFKFDSRSMSKFILRRTLRLAVQNLETDFIWMTSNLLIHPTSACAYSLAISTRESSHWRSKLPYLWTSINGLMLSEVLYVNVKALEILELQNYHDYERYWPPQRQLIRSKWSTLRMSLRGHDWVDVNGRKWGTLWIFWNFFNFSFAVVRTMTIKFTRLRIPSLTLLHSVLLKIVPSLAHDLQRSCDMNSLAHWWQDQVCCRITFFPCRSLLLHFGRIFLTSLCMQS